MGNLNISVGQRKRIWERMKIKNETILGTEARSGSINNEFS